MLHDLPAPSLVDVIALAVVAFAALRGAFRGLSGELAGLFGNAAGLVVGIVCFHPLGIWLSNQTRLSGRAAFAAAFLITVLGCIVLMLVLRWTVGRVLHVVAEDGLDRAGGIFAGIVRGVVTVIMVFIAVNLIPSEGLNRRFGEDSVVGTLVQRWTPHLQDVVQNAANFEFFKPAKH